MGVVDMIIATIIVAYLLIMAIIDIRNKAIPIVPGVVMLIVVAVVRLVMGVSPITVGAGIGIGVLLYGVSRISRGEIGEADGLVYAVTGAALGMLKNCELLLVSLLLASLVGLVLLIFKKVGRKYRLPFVPFTLVSYGMVMLL